MHYVCSDIHGQYDMFQKMLKLIKFSDSDEMYVLGDVIDRGPKPIDTLIHCMTAPNIHLMIGNHEQMMLECTSDLKLLLWHQNGAVTTLRQLKKYSNTWKTLLLKKMSELPVVIPDLEVSGKHYYLVHARPIQEYLGQPLLYCDATDTQIESATWDRTFETSDVSMRSLFNDQSVFEKNKGKTLIIGHSPTDRCSYGTVTKNLQPRISRAYHGYLINLDCGCSHGRNLGCLRLEDQAEFYCQ